MNKENKGVGNQVNSKTIVLVAGGTGGHVFPALALMEELRKRGHKISLIVDDRGLKYLPESHEGLSVHKLSIRHTKGRTYGLALKIIDLLRGLFSSYTYLKSIRPHIVIGFGGYPSVAPILAAFLCRAPTMIHEQNALMGRINRLLVPFVSHVALSFEKTKKFSSYQRATWTGNPVRASILQYVGAPLVQGTKKVLFISGGSQGAHFLNDIVPLALQELDKRYLEEIEVIHQCSADLINSTQRFYQNLGIEALLKPFFHDIPQILAQCHLVICRAGASTLTELMVVGRPAIMIPYPHARDDHQYYNAKMVERGGGVCLRQEHVTPKSLSQQIKMILFDRERLENIATLTHKLAKSDAHIKFADCIENQLSLKNIIKK